MTWRRAFPQATFWQVRLFGGAASVQTIPCAAVNTLLLVVLYHWTSWAAFAKQAGCNALLAYMLAYVAYFIPFVFRITAKGTAGWYGVM